MQGNLGNTCASGCHEVFVSNIKNDETFCYSLVIIKGGIINNTDNQCFQQNCKIKLRSSKSLKTTEWPVTNLLFKCLVELNFGDNHVNLEFYGSVLDLTLHYVPRKTPLSVIPVYIICHGHDGKFQAPTGTDNSIRSACERISLGAKIIQTLMAEKLNEHNMGRKTFQLERDIDPSAPECVTFHSQLSLENARKMTSQELWEHFGRELMMSSLGSTNRKFMAFLSCTRYNPPSDVTMPNTYAEMLSLMEAHVALGGGGLAIFGSACMYTWAKSVEEIIPCFLDQSKIDSRYFMDDSCYRGTYGSCFSTTLGSVCHELGHTFDLGHSTEGIMGRGFDNIDLVFTVQFENNNENRHFNTTCKQFIKPMLRETSQNSTICLTRLLQLSYTVEPPVEREKEKMNRDGNIHFNKSEKFPTDKLHSIVKCAVNHNEKSNETANRLIKKRTECSLKFPSDHTYWSKSCATLLSYHRWFNNNSDEYSGAFRLDSHRNVLYSPAGIRVMEIRDSSGQILSSWQFLEEGQTTLKVPLEACSKTSHLLVAEDSVGNILKLSLPLQTAAS